MLFTRSISLENVLTPDWNLAIVAIVEISPDFTEEDTTRQDYLHKIQALQSSFDTTD